MAATSRAERDSGSPENIVLISNTSFYLYNFRRSTIQALSDRYRIVCISPFDSYSERLISELGTRHIHLPMEGRSLNPIKELYCILVLGFWLARLRPSFVFNFTVKVNVYSGIICSLLGRPYANNISGLGTAFLYERFFYRLVRHVYRWANRGARCVFVQNPEDRALFEQSGLARDVPLVQIPGSGVDLDRFAPAAMPQRPPFVFLMIARLLGDKGVREYVAAARGLRSEDGGARCLLVGGMGEGNRSGIPEAELRGWIEEGSIEYFSHQSDVRPFLRDCHVVVLPSYREGMPRVVLEAAASARPALVSDVPGCRHAVIAGETGWLCPARDARALQARMRDVMALSEEALQAAGRAARVLAERSFSEERVVEATLRCVEQRP